MGVADGDLRRSRRDVVGEICGAGQGGNASAKLALAPRWGAGPAYEAHCLPLRAWVDNWMFDEIGMSGTRGRLRAAPLGLSLLPLKRPRRASVASSHWITERGVLAEIELTGRGLPKDDCP